jgi:hypothetical protein
MKKFTPNQLNFCENKQIFISQFEQNRDEVQQLLELRQFVYNSVGGTNDYLFGPQSDNPLEFIVDLSVFLEWSNVDIDQGFRLRKNLVTLSAYIKNSVPNADININVGELFAHRLQNLGHITEHFYRIFLITKNQNDFLNTKTRNNLLRFINATLRIAYHDLFHDHGESFNRALYHIVDENRREKLRRKVLDKLTNTTLECLTAKKKHLDNQYKLLVQTTENDAKWFESVIEFFRL